MLSMASYILVFIATSSLAFAEDGKKCSYRPIKSQLEMLGFDLSKDTKKFDLSSDFTKDVNSLAEKYSKEDPEYVSATKKVEEYLSATKNLNDQIDHVEKLRNKWTALENKIPELAPSAFNKYKNDPALAKAIQERDSLGIEINKLSKKILTESKPFLRGKFYNYCSDVGKTRFGVSNLAFEKAQHKLAMKLDRFFPPENRFQPRTYNPSAYRLQDEFCNDLNKALKYIAEVDFKSKKSAFANVMKPITDSPHGSQFVHLFDDKEAAPFDSVEKVTANNGQSLWLVKYRGEIKTAYLINDEKKNIFATQHFFISPTKCILNIDEWKTKDNASYLAYRINEDLCQAVREETNVPLFC